MSSIVSIPSAWNDKMWKGLATLGLTEDFHRPLYWSLILAMCTTTMSIFTWSKTPESIPIWWNLDGSPLLSLPRWLTLPTLSAFEILVPCALYLAVSRDSSIDKHTPKSKTAVAELIFFPSFVVFLTNVFWQQALASDSFYRHMLRFQVATMALIFSMTLGSNLRHVEPNHAIGVLTPWTIKSDRVWKSTHAEACLVLRTAGIIHLFCAFCMPHSLFIPSFAITLLLLVAPVLWLGSYLSLFWYSWVISREIFTDELLIKPLIPQGFADDPFIPRGFADETLKNSSAISIQTM